MNTPAHTPSPQATPDNKQNVSNETQNALEVVTGSESSLTSDLPLTPKHVLQLQRAIGNRATTQLISKQPQPAIQRGHGDTTPVTRPSTAPPYVPRPSAPTPTGRP